MGMCRLTKTQSPVLSLYLETVYVNEVAARGYAVRPNLDIPAVARGPHSSGGKGGVGDTRVTPSS
jgi:hypothetical protein